MLPQDAKLYRYMSFQRFYQLLFQKKIVLVLPEKWDDEYEQFWLKSLASPEGQARCRKYIEGLSGNKAKINDEIEKLSGLLFKATYCLCFSTKKDSEILWRAYSDNKKGIMIATTREKIESVFPELPVIKEVVYDLDQRDMFGSFMKHFKVLSDGSVIHWDISDFLLHKRECFSYEEEVRVMVHDWKATESGLLPVSIPDLRAFIDGVMVHPSADQEYVEVIELLCDHFSLPFLGKSRVYDFVSQQFTIPDGG